MKKIIICEKNSLAEAIKHGIESRYSEMKSVVYHKGKDALSTLIYYENEHYIVTSVVGHIFELYSIADYEGVEKINWSDISLPYSPDNFYFKTKIKKEFNKRFKMIRELVTRKDVDGVFNCGDNDREGVILIREVLNEIELDKPIYRLALAEVTDNSVINGLNKLVSDNEFDNIANEGFARQYADWLYGINLTTYATVKMNQGFYSVGRVISAVVNAIYERDMAIANFKSQKYVVGVSNEYTNDVKIEITDKEKFFSNENNIITDDIKQKYNNYFNELNNSIFKVTDKKSKEKMKRRIKEITKRNRPISSKELAQELKLYITGWINYYRIADMRGYLGKVDSWLRRRIRMIYWKRWKLVRTRYRNLQKLGIDRNKAWEWANTRKSYWHIANSFILSRTLTNERLKRFGFVSTLDYYNSINL